MLAIHKLEASTPSWTPSIVPCRIHHTGPTKITKRYWAPTKEKDGSHTVHFRGRKLRGRPLKLPAKYQGLILKSTDRTLPQPAQIAPPLHFEDDDDGGTDQEEQEELPETVHVLEKISTFDELLVWGHDQLPASEEAFVKNIEEWITFAEAVHGNPQMRKEENSTERISEKSSNA